MTPGAPVQGTTIGSYVLRHEIGAGGMGTVFLAEHTMLGRRAALKVLRPEFSANQEMVTRFFNEARAASAIKSPGIVEIYDFGYHVDRSAYIVMELLEGEPLTQRLRRFRCLPLPQALTIGRQIASALAPAHRAGIVHRDLKPDNIYLVPDGETVSGERVKLLDFGIAKLSQDGLGAGVHLTSTKVVMGSPQYMSPEQCKGAGVVDARSDLYALGCILYELICGRPPFVGEGFGELMGAHLHVQAAPLSAYAPATPPDVDALVQRLLAKPPDHRPATAEAVATALNDLLVQLRPGAATLMAGGPLAFAPPQAMPMPTPHALSAPHPMPTPYSLTPPPMALTGPGRDPHGLASPTTLRQSSGAVMMTGEAPKSGRGLAIGVAVSAVVSTVVAVGVIASSRSGGDAPPPSAVAAAPSPAPAASVAAAPTPAPARAPSAAALPAPAATPDGAAAASEAPPATAAQPAATSSDPTAIAASADKDKDKPRGHRKPKVDPATIAAPTVPELAETLSVAAQAAGVDSVLGNIRGCATAAGVKGPVYSQISVLPSGRVREAKITSSTDAKLSGCVVTHLIRAKFEATQQGGTFRKVFILE